MTEHNFSTIPQTVYHKKNLKNTKLCYLEFLSLDMTSDPSDYHRQYSPEGSFSLVQLEGSDLISALKTLIEHSFVFFKCSLSLSFKLNTSRQYEAGSSIFGIFPGFFCLFIPFLNDVLLFCVKRFSW